MNAFFKRYLLECLVLIGFLLFILLAGCGKTSDREDPPTPPPMEPDDAKL